MSDVLTQLGQILADRKTMGAADNSYVAQLHSKGLNKILEKVGEECTEMILAAKEAQYGGSNSNHKSHLIAETADLWFHSMVALSYFDIDSQAVLDELENRFGLSGLEEKASRN